MKHSEFIWDEFIYGGHWGSIGASAVALSTMIILELQIRWEFLIIAYLGTQCIYNYNHYKELDIDAISNPSRVNHLKKYKKYLPSITAFYGISFLALLLFFGDRTSCIFGGLLLLLGLAFTYKGKKISKNVVGFKSVYASFSWSLLTVFTAIYHSYSLSMSLLIIFIFVFLRLMINTSFFDIKDMQSDKKEGLQTLPLIFKNKQNWLNILHIINFISLVPIIFGVLAHVLPSYSLFSLFLFFYSFYYIRKAKSEKTNIWSLTYVMADGEFYYWPFLLVMGLIFASLNLLW